jgi:hypothetical protein
VHALAGGGFKRLADLASNAFQGDEGVVEEGAAGRGEDKAADRGLRLKHPLVQRRRGGKWGVRGGDEEVEEGSEMEVSLLEWILQILHIEDIPVSRDRLIRF